MFSLCYVKIIKVYYGIIKIIIMWGSLRITISWCDHSMYFKNCISGLQNCKLNDIHLLTIRFANFFKNVNWTGWHPVYKLQTIFYPPISHLVCNLYTGTQPVRFTISKISYNGWLHPNDLIISTSKKTFFTI